MRGDRLASILLAMALTLAAGAAQPSKEGRGSGAAFMAPSGPSSAYIESAITTEGQFTFGVPAGPILLYGHPSPWSGFTTERIDGVDFTNNGGSTFGSVVQLPTNVGNTNEGIWTNGSIEIHQIIKLVKGYSTNKEDTYLIQYTLINRGSSTRQVGLRIMFDTDLANNDGAPFQVPGTGSVTTAKTWLGENIPPYFFVFNDLNHPEVTAQGSLLGGELVLAPDKFVIAPWGSTCGGGIYDTTWDFITSEQNVVCDSAYAVYWEPRPLAPGATVSFGTYYGLGGIEVDTNPPLISSLTGPVFLDCQQVLTPNPFTLSLYLENSIPGTNATVTGITATLTLPPGLRVAPGSEVQNVADMEHGASNLLSWNVVADGTVRGDLEYSITIASLGAGTKTTRRKVSVPAGCPTGDLPPVVGVTAPAAGAEVSCSTTFQSSVWDDQGSATVQYYVDGQALGGPISSPPYSYLLDVNGWPNGQHSVYSTAKDGAGHLTKSNKVTFWVTNPAISWMSYDASSKRIRVYGENLRSGQQVTVSGEPTTTTFKTESLPIYKTDFSTFNTVSWVVAGAYTHTKGSSGGTVSPAPDTTMARNVPTSGYTHIKVGFVYDYTLMDEGEGILLEYSTTGSEGPWVGGYSDLSLKPDGGTGGQRKGTFLCPVKASDNADFWIRFRNVRVQNHEGPNGILNIHSVNVVSLRDYLLGKGLPKIGHAQTVPIRILYDSCQTAPYLYTRP
jgi:hypothetical protein